MLVLFLSLLIQYVSLLLFFKFKGSLPNSFIIIPVGVTTKKNIMPIIIGAIIFPINIPNLNQILFKGVNSFEFINPNTKKIKDTIKDQYLIILISIRVK